METQARDCRRVLLSSGDIWCVFSARADLGRGEAAGALVGGLFAMGGDGRVIAYRHGIIVRLAGPGSACGEPRRRGLELGGDYVYITVFCFTGQAKLQMSDSQ